MIIQEFYEQRFDGVNLYRTYSDKGFYIEQEQTGIQYTEAIDIENSEFTYIETDILINEEEKLSEIEQKAQAWDILTGEEVINE